MKPDNKMHMPNRENHNACKLFQMWDACLRISVTPVVYALLYLSSANVFAANFPLDFSGNGAPTFNTNIESLEGSCTTTGCAGNDGTRFSQDLVVIDGVAYFHNVIGQESAGFAVEYYTRSSISAGFIGNRHASGSFVVGTVVLNPDYGGMESAIYSGVTENCQDDGSGWPGICGTGIDPLNVAHTSDLSGTGSGDPSKMVMRMVMDDGSGMSLEVYKPTLDGKPRITQTVIDGGMRSEYVTDMQAISYSDMSTAAPVVNRQIITDPGMPVPDAGNFDMSMVKDSEITAGRFIYTRGSGWINGDTEFVEGSYTYIDNGFDPLNADWSSYFNSSENATACNTGNRQAALCPN